MKASCTASSASAGSDSILLASASILGRWRSISRSAAARSPRPTRATSSASGSIIIPDQSVPVLFRSSTQPPRFSVVQRLVDQAQEFRTLTSCRCPQALEVVARQTNVGIEFVFAMLVKVQERAACAIEVAARLFLEAFALANVLEQRLGLVEGRGTGMLHPQTGAGIVARCKCDSGRADWRKRQGRKRLSTPLPPNRIRRFRARRACVRR